VLRGQREQHLVRLAVTYHFAQPFVGHTGRPQCAPRALQPRPRPFLFGGDQRCDPVGTQGAVSQKTAACQIHLLARRTVHDVRDHELLHAPKW